MSVKAVGSAADGVDSGEEAFSVARDSGAVMEPLLLSPPQENRAKAVSNMNSLVIVL
jgi:hypothetical protein